MTQGNDLLVKPINRYTGLVYKYCFTANLGHAYLMKKHYKSLMWTSYDLPGVLEERGVLDKDKLPGFHYRDDALRLWQIIKEYIADILNIYYHSDKDVEKVSLSLLSILVMGALVKFSVVVGTEWDIS